MQLVGLCKVVFIRSRSPTNGPKGPSQQHVINSSLWNSRNPTQLSLKRLFGPSLSLKQNPVSPSPVPGGPGYHLDAPERRRLGFPSGPTETCLANGRPPKSVSGAVNRFGLLPSRTEGKPISPRSWCHPLPIYDQVLMPMTMPKPVTAQVNE